MKKLIILPIAIASIASAEQYEKIVINSSIIDTMAYYPRNIVEPAMRYEVTITDVKLTDDGKLEVHYRREDLWGDDEVWKDVYEAVPRIRPGTEHIQCKHCGEYQVKDYIIVKDKTVYAKVIPEKTTPERIEWEE